MGDTVLPGVSCQLDPYPPQLSWQPSIQLSSAVTSDTLPDVVWLVLITACGSCGFQLVLKRCLIRTR